MLERILGGPHIVLRGIGFDYSWMVSGLIEMPVLDCLAGSMKLGDKMRDRQLCMVAYLFE
jgi:hypothetical protein